MNRKDALQAFLSGTQGSNPFVERDTRLTELLKGSQLKQEAIDRNRGLAEQTARDHGLKPGKYSITANESGFGVNPENENFMALLNLRDRQDARDDRDLTKLGERLEKSNIPGTSAAMSNLEAGTSSTDDSGKPVGGILTNPNYAPKSTGPFANSIRSLPLGQSALNIGEKIGLMPKGASEETALIQRLMNQDIRNMSGTAVTAYEQGRQNLEKGMTGGGDPELVKIGIKQMQDALVESSRNIESSTRPSVSATYRKQGGKITLEEYLGKSPKTSQQASGGLSAQEQAELEQLRREMGR